MIEVMPTVATTTRTVRPVSVPSSVVSPARKPPLSVLAMILLEPESDDALAVWNVFDPSLRVGATHPVRRLLGPLVTPRRAIN